MNIDSSISKKQMKIRCLVVDDEPIARKGMLEYVCQIDFLEPRGAPHNAMEVYSILNQETIDLIFLDIEMPKLSGIDLVRSLKNPPLVIFTTAYPSYAVEGYELDAVDYLVKPVSFPRFLKAVNKARDLMQIKHAQMEPHDNNDHFFLKEDGKFIKVLYDDILYAEALQNYVAIHLSSKKLITYSTLTFLESQLPASRFLRIHKSYIVSLRKIERIEGGTVIIQSTTIPVSRKLREQLKQKLLENKLLKR